MSEMNEFTKFQEKLEQESIQNSLGPGLYRLNIAQKENKVAYPWAPTMRIQRYITLAWKMQMHL